MRCHSWAKASFSWRMTVVRTCHLIASNSRYFGDQLFCYVGLSPELLSQLVLASTSYGKTRTYGFDLGSCGWSVWGDCYDNERNVTMVDRWPELSTPAVVRRLHSPFCLRLAKPVAVQLFLSPASSAQPIVSTLCHVFLVPPMLRADEPSFEATIAFIDCFSLQLLLAVPIDSIESMDQHQLPHSSAQPPAELVGVHMLLSIRRKEQPVRLPLQTVVQKASLRLHVKAAQRLRLFYETRNSTDQE